jgi:putative lipoic acid-binding regulatory protein
LRRGFTGVSDEGTLLRFPCDLPIKVFGRNDERFRAVALAIVREHCEEFALSEQTSRGGNYLSLTITVRAQNKPQVDAVYRALTASESILMVL